VDVQDVNGAKNFTKFTIIMCWFMLIIISYKHTYG